MERSIHFVLLILGQFLLYSILALWRRCGVRKYWRVLGISVLLGLPLGMIFDLYIGGKQAVFSYPGFPHSYVFVLLNGALSYGLAIASAWLLPGKLTVQPTVPRFWLLSLIVMLLLLAVTLISIDHSLLVRMVLLGLIILCVSEIVTLACKMPGLQSRFIATRDPQFFLFWLGCILIGGIYEMINMAFPVWHWHLQQEIGFWGSEFILVVFGYVVLLYPAFTLSRLIENKWPLSPS